jgi:GPH family glycoside/pentoside/hexuronide:cation symporter
LHPLIVGQFPGNLALGYSVSMGLWTVLAVLPLFWCFWGVEERFSSERSEMPLGTQVRVALSNRPYLFVIGIYLCSWLAVQLTATIIPYYITYWMRLPNTWIAGIILAVQGTSLVMLFVWSAVSNKIGKKNVYLIGMSLWIVAQVGLLVLQPGQTILMVILAILAGMGVSTAYLIPWSMIPDVIELDELETGERREGIFYAFMVLLQKISIALGLFLVGQALQATHFISATVQVPQPVQPESALLALRLILGPVPLVLVVLGMVLCWFYPITRASHQLVLDQLAQRRAA